MSEQREKEHLDNIIYSLSTRFDETSAVGEEVAIVLDQLTQAQAERDQWKAKAEAYEAALNAMANNAERDTFVHRFTAALSASHQPQDGKGENK